MNLSPFLILGGPGEPKERLNERRWPSSATSAQNHQSNLQLIHLNHKYLQIQTRLAETTASQEKAFLLRCDV